MGCLKIVFPIVLLYLAAFRSLHHPSSIHLPGWDHGRDCYLHAAAGWLRWGVVKLLFWSMFRSTVAVQRFEPPIPRLLFFLLSKLTLSLTKYDLMLSLLLLMSPLGSVMSMKCFSTMVYRTSICCSSAEKRRRGSGTLILKKWSSSKGGVY